MPVMLAAQWQCVAADNPRPTQPATVADVAAALPLSAACLPESILGHAENLPPAVSRFPESDWAQGANQCRRSPMMGLNWSGWARCHHLQSGPGSVPAS